MNPQDYDGLFNRDFTVDGDYLYLQDSHNSCCINRNIRVDITRFKFSKKNLKDLQNWQDFLDGKRAIYEAPHVVPDRHSKSFIPDSVKEKLESELNSPEFLEKVNRALVEYHTTFSLAPPFPIERFPVRENSGCVGLNFITVSYWKTFKKD